MLIFFQYTSANVIEDVGKIYFLQTNPWSCYRNHVRLIAEKKI